MTAQVLCFASPKGGSGKTFVSASIASFLGSLGKKVLLIDMDAATNGLSLFYLGRILEAKEHALETHNLKIRGIYETNRDKRVMACTVSANVDLVPATYVMKQTEGFEYEAVRSSVQNTITALSNEYDYILLDAQAGSDGYAHIALELARTVVIVSEFDPISAEGVERLRYIFPQRLTYERTWILFNKVLPDVAKSLGDFLEVVRYLPPIPWDADVVRAYVRRRLALDMEVGNPHTIALAETVSVLLGQDVEEHLKRWKETRAEQFRAPLREQLDETQRGIEAIERARIDARYRAQGGISTLPLLIAMVSGAAAGGIVLFARLDWLSWPFPLATTLYFVPIAVVSVWQLWRRRSLQRDRALEELDLEFRSRLDELRERSDKYKAMLDSAPELDAARGRLNWYT